jgi:exopolyphosphatase/guanosine-5'-triphosphate,3'-diphosphate pyrophosphatase
MRQAVIDVGTNSVKLLVAEVEGGRVQPLLEQSEQTRLGQGFYQTQRLQSEAITRTAGAVAGFAMLAGQWKAASPRIIGTSAARDAENKDELIQAIEQTTGLRLEIISGEQEAEWVFHGVTSDPKLHGTNLLILDVGGGSTEFILGQGDFLRRSFPLGSLRLLEKLRPQDPPTPADLAACRAWLRDYFMEHIIRAFPASVAEEGSASPQLVGTGGTVTILARMEGRLESFDRERIEGMRFSRAQVSRWMEQLWSLPLAQRKDIVGLPRNRADVILMGVAIYEAVMEHLHFADLYVSTRGLRFGVLTKNDHEKTLGDLRL